MTYLRTGEGPTSAGHFKTLIEAEGFEGCTLRPYGVECMIIFPLNYGRARVLRTVEDAEQFLSELR